MSTEKREYDGRVQNANARTAIKAPLYLIYAQRSFFSDFYFSRKKCLYLVRTKTTSDVHLYVQKFTRRVYVRTVYLYFFFVHIFIFRTFYRLPS